MKDKAKAKAFYKKSLIKLVSVVVLISMLMNLSVILGNANTYHTLRINYVFADGTPAHDPYIATYQASDDPLHLEVKNPVITGYDPMTATDETGLSAEITTIDLEHIDRNVELTVYYLAGLSNYRVMYYKQNVYDDLYTRDNAIATEYTNRRGKTGTNPTILENEELPGYEGFTNLFHEPDSIAADGSTVFRVYYDRNYYHVLFDLGDGGYGVEPVYAKYESVYHISEPKRSGYSFLGWVRTDKDSTQSDDWNYVNGDGDAITEEQALASPISLDGDQYVPAENTYYKAIWTSDTTKYSVVYWIQNPGGRDLRSDELNHAGSISAARSLISSNYSVVAMKDIEDVPSGTGVNLDTTVTNNAGQSISIKDFFSYDLSENGDFPAMSSAKRSELLGKSKYYDFNSDISSLQFHGEYEQDPDKNYINIAGDGTTRINVYYNRKNFTLKFYYAQEQLNSSTGQPNGKVQLTNSTKAFSEYNYYGKNEAPAAALSKGTWAWNTAETRPKIAEKYRGILTPSAQDEDGLYEDYNGYRYYYYEVSAHYNESLEGKWLIDAITPVHKKDKDDPDEICYPGSWATEYDTLYQYNNTTSNGGKRNYTIKGIYDKLGDDLLFRTRTQDFTTLHFLLSWTNSAATDNGWNYGVSKVLHFRYENYVELLPKEIELAENSGNQALIDNGTYLDVIERTFTDTITTSPTYGQSITRMYGLPSGNRIETTDSGDQYPFKSDPARRSENNGSVYTNQTAAELTGFQIENYVKGKTGKVTLDANNTEIDWSNDTSTYRQATIKFFYHRNTYTLEYRNGSEAERTYSIMYGAPLNSAYTNTEGGHTAGEYRYWYDNPRYFNEDLEDYYIFSGWYYTPFYYRQVNKDTATMPADDVTFYAKWVAKTIKVSFYPTYNDYYENVNRIGSEITVDYGNYIPHELIPANIVSDERPHLTPPATGAMFAGWYYLRDNIPVRFEPENLPVTALNQESSGENATFHLYAEWVTKEVGKYEIRYVEKNNHDNEVAPPTTGRAFVWKTRTFTAKGGSELNAEHAWQENGINWWPVANSHSLVIKANDHRTSDYSPNEYPFEYIQKSGVWYRVQYLDAVTHSPVADSVEYYTTDASVIADSLFIPGYVAEEMSKSLVLSASEKTGDAAKAEELENNSINFYYNQNDTDYLYEVEYYGQNVDDDGYELIQAENIEVEIADDPDTPEIEPTTVLLSNIYTRQYAMLFEVNGFTRVAGATQQAVANPDGTTTTTALDDNSSFTVTSDRKTTIRVYYNRKTYPYKFRYVDYHAERKYLDKDEAEREGMWDGVMETHYSTSNERVEKQVVINAPTDLTYNNIPYIRIGENDVILTIAPDENNPDVNVINVYYKKFNERELQYKLVCKDSPENELDYDISKNPPQPLFGGLSMTAQTVDTYGEIQSVNFYDFNNAEDPEADPSLPESERYLHNHRYNFLGWFDNPEGTGTPLSADENLSPAEMTGNTEELPTRNTTYYAVVEQQMVHANFEFRLVESALPIGGDSGETEEDRQAALILATAPVDTDGSQTGCTFNFSSPSNYTSGDPTPWHRNQGYNLTVDPVDDRVYKYEFAEWWEEDLTPGDNYGKLIRKKNWNSDGEWSPTVLQQVLDRQSDKHVIAVYKRREVTELPYTINYTFTDRFGETKTFVKTGTLSGDQLNEASKQCCITNDGDFRLTDDFIIANSPYESNYGQTLRWSDQQIKKTSYKGDEAEGTVDRITANVTAVQSPKTVYATYCTTPGGESVTISLPYGANYNTKGAEGMLNIEAPAAFNGNKFRYWAVRKSSAPDAPIVAKSYETLFDLCMMDSYFLSPVYEGAAEGPGSNSATLAFANDIVQGNEDWIAWTRIGNESATWVRHDSNMTFNGLGDYVQFVRVDPDIDISNGSLSFLSIGGDVWNYTPETGVEDGGTFRITGYADDSSNYMYGSWDNPSAPVTGPGDNSAVLACAAGVEQFNEDWLAWTWSDGIDGVWVRCGADKIFTGLRDKVKFVRVPRGTDISGNIWDESFSENVWNYTDELDVTDGYTFTITSYSGDLMIGSWGETPEPTEPEPTESEPGVVLTHLGYSRNRWTESDGSIPSTGETDLLFTDFEIAFEDGGNHIYGSESGYRVGVVFELCGTLSAGAMYDPERNYGFCSDSAALKEAIAAGNTSYVTQNKENSDKTKTRRISCCDIDTASLTNRNRVEFAQYYPNAYKLAANGDKTYTNSTYLMKATAYLIKDGNVTLSNSMYICLKTEASRNLAVGENNIWTVTPTSD